MINTHFRSVTIPLEDFINSDNERIILENLRRCSKLVGKTFQVNLWYTTLKQKQIKEFIERNEHLLFEVNTKISKGPERAWFCINPVRAIVHGQCRYYYNGDILTGIINYLDMCKFFQKKENEDD